MKLTDITPAIALTPLDGRYHKQTAPLVEYLSEPALNRERMRVEVEWMILLDNGFDLPEWHPLKTGRAASVHEANMSLKGRETVSETGIQNYENYIVYWEDL